MYSCYYTTDYNAKKPTAAQPQPSQPQPPAKPAPERGVQPLPLVGKEVVPVTPKSRW